jgi:glycosyltransferase involved in cell wall biosynthesis
VGIPAYNEEKYISGIVLRARQYAGEVVVVDDGSRDATAAVAGLAGARVISHRQNQGYGGAIQRIFSEARRRQPDVLVVLDGDAQHNPDEIPALVKAVREGADVVIGSRRLRKNSIPAYRRLGQRVLARLSNVASGSGLSDTESGFRAYSRRAVTTLEPKETGMAVSAEIVAAAAAQGLKITEVPASVNYDTETSTHHPVSHGLGVMRWILNLISEKRPLLFFGAGGSVCILLALWFGVVVMQVLQNEQVLQVGTALISMLFITVGVLLIIAGLILDVITRRLGRK